LAILPAARVYVDLLEEADQFCRSGALLMPPPSERVRRLRRWFVEEMAAQFDGRPASHFGEGGQPADGPAGRG
jgi:hypothetical protein